MAAPVPQLQRTQWLILVVSMAASVLLYGAVALALLANRTPEDVHAAPTVLRLVLLAAGLGAAAAGLALAPRVQAGADPGTLQEPPRFTRQSLVAVALLESAALLGLVGSFLGAPLSDLALLAGVALAGILLHVVPNGLRYWQAREGGGAGAPPPSLDPS